MGYNSIVWLPVCAGLTVLGLILSYVAGRRRGRLSMLRGAAWSLLPLAIYLTGSVEMFWRIGTAIAHYAAGFVFSPVKWAGLGVTALAAVLFAATSGRERRRAARAVHRAGGPRPAAPQSRPAELQTRPGVTSPPPDPAAPKPRKPAADDDLNDIEDILRKRGL